MGTLGFITLAVVGVAAAVTVDTDCGPVHGQTGTNGISAFLGIPYAQSPLGKLRWQPPLRRTKADGTCWKGTFNATSFGDACMQHSRFTNSDSTSFSEDCLALSVWTNASTAEKALPVVVFLHGGDLVEGSMSAIQAGFGAEANMTSAGVVSVAINYRLGVIGFLALDCLSQNDVRGRAGNYGLLDTIAALQWVQRNIAAFGGDPDRVTVYGQSSGGSLVLALLSSPEAQGLFARGISMSGSPRLNSTVQEASHYWHPQVVARLPSCKDIPLHACPALLDCLYDAAPEDLVKVSPMYPSSHLTSAQAMPPNWSPDGFGFTVFNSSWEYAPILLVDGPGGVLPLDYLSALSPSHHSPPTPWSTGTVSAAIGVTREEIDFAPQDDVRNLTLSQFQQFLRNKVQPFYSDTFVNRMLALYGVDGHSSSPLPNQRVYARIVTDATILCPSLYLADAMTTNRNSSPPPTSQHAASAPSSLAPLYVYTTSQTPSSPGGFCELEPFQRFRYCPQYSMHGWDEFSMFQPYFSPLYSFSSNDRAFGAQLRSRFDQLASTGQVDAWRAYRERLCDEESAPECGDVGNYSVVDECLDESNVPNLLHDQCSFWIEHGFYQNKALIN